jgi:hypothetical protein
MFSPFKRLSISLLIVVLWAVPVPAQQPADKAVPAASPLTEKSLKQCSVALRDLLVKNLPDPLYEASPGWGTTANVASGIHWHGKGLNVEPKITYTRRNNGAWRKVRLTLLNPAGLVLDLRDARQPQPGTTTFTAQVGFDARMDFEQQTWESGLKVHDGSVRARFHVNMTLDCELTSRLENKGGLLPDVVFRLRVVKSRLSYDHLVVEHIAGVGGDVAKQLGKTAHECLQQWHPSIERKLLEKAEAAIVKAGDTKEVRLSLLGKH